MRKCQNRRKGKYLHDFSHDILEYIVSHPKQPLSNTLKYISRKDCVSYQNIYQALFKNIHLTKLEGRETIYVMKL